MVSWSAAAARKVSAAQNVHPDEQHHRGPGGQVQGGVAHGHGVGDDPDHAGAGLLQGLDALLLHPAAQLGHQLQGGVHPRVGQDEGLLQLVVEVVVQLRAEAGEQVDLFQLVKKAHGVVPLFIIFPNFFAVSAPTGGGHV